LAYNRGLFGRGAGSKNKGECKDYGRIFKTCKRLEKVPDIRVVKALLRRAE
jgi:hypothetical protein